MLTLVVIVAVAIALMRGGHIGNLSNLPLRKIGWFISAFLLQILLRLLSGRVVTVKYGPLIHIISYVFIVIGLWYNWKVREVKIIGIGVLLNFIVIVANGGRMPVLINTPNLKSISLRELAALANGSNPIHSLYNKSTRFGFLSDIFSLPAFFLYPVIFSIGDLILSVGVFILIQRVMLAPKIRYLPIRRLKR